MRLRLAASLAESVPEPESSLVQALLLGLRDDLPDDMTESFRRTGTAHVLAISGLHIGILLALSLGLSGRLLGRRHQLYLLPPLALVWLYALLSGMSPSVTRAAIMGSVYLAALFLGRPRSVLPALGLAAAVMVAISPGVLWSVSFQLSFAAMIGIAALAGPIAEWLRRQYDGQARNGAGAAMLLDGVSYSAAMTIGATATTLPLVMLYFERVSLVGLPTTLLVLPALPIVLVTGALTGLAGLIDGAVAEPIGWLAWLASTYVTSVVDAISRLPGVVRRHRPGRALPRTGVLRRPRGLGRPTVETPAGLAPCRRGSSEPSGQFPSAALPFPGGRSRQPSRLRPLSGWLHRRGRTVGSMCPLSTWVREMPP